MSRRIAILGGQRIPFARSMDQYLDISNLQLMSFPMRELVRKFKLEGKEIGEVSLGAVMKHPEEWNLARECTIECGLSARTPAYDVQQACGTSLETAILVGNKIALGQIEVGIAGGVDSNSDIAVTFPKSFGHKMIRAMKAKSTMGKMAQFLSLRPSDLKPVFPGVVEPRTGLSMGQSCEKMAKDWQITRGAQDELALASHKNAGAAYEQHFYDDLIVPFKGLNRDNNVRVDTSLEKLSRLKPAFSKDGTLTAGNSTPLTDGAACVLLSSEEWAQKNNFEVLAYMTHVQVAAVDFVTEEGLLMAPAYAVPRMLKNAGLNLQDFDFYEIHEAFAAQVLCTLKAWESEDFCKQKLGLEKALGSVDRSKLNVKGGSLALGHPFAATGARIIASLAKILKEKGSGRGLISICTAGGMGVTAILEK